MGRTNQGGSILSFIIVGIVAAALLVAGVYVVRNYQAVSSELAAGPAMPGDTEQKPSNDEASKPANESTDKADKKADDSKKTDTKPKPAPVDDKPAKDTTKSDSDAAPAPKPDDTAKTPTQPSAETIAPADDQPASKKDTAVLPQTGPADTLANAFGAGLFVVASLAYIRSCRSLGTL